MQHPWPSLLSILIGIAFLIYYHYRYKKRNYLLKNGEEAEGVIVSLKHHSEADSPVIHFVTHNGVSITEEYEIGSTSYKIGQKVKVVYDPLTPKKFTLSNDTSTIFIKYLYLTIGVGFIYFGVRALFNF